MEDYEIREGTMIARRNLLDGFNILEEEPLMTLEHDEDIWSNDDKLKSLVDQQLKQSSAQQRKQFCELKDNFAQRGNEKTLVGIFRSNCLLLPDNTWSVFQTLSMVEHDCMPNTMVIHDKKTGKVVLRTVKSVPKDSGITLSLLNTWPIVNRAAMMKLFATSADRSQMLLEQHGIVCRCQCCVNGSDDYKRSRILQLEFYGRYSETADEQIEEQMALCKEIGLHSGIIYLICLKHIMALHLAGKTDEMKVMSSEAKQHALRALGGHSSVVQLTNMIGTFENETQLYAPIKELRSLLSTYTWFPEPSKVVETTVMGKGLVSCFDCHPGDIILEEEPLFMIAFDQEPNRQNLTKQSIGQAIQNSVEGLCESDKEDLASLAGDSDAEGEPDYYKIVKANSYVIGKTLCLFMELGRINHSCLPNTFIMHNSQEGKVAVRALKNVKRGEEITISYFEDMATFHSATSVQRRALLEEHFGFTCLCPVCVTGHCDDERSKFTFLRNAPSWPQNGRQYSLFKELGVHTSAMFRATFNYLKSGFITYHKEREELYQTLCHELREQAQVMFNGYPDLLAQFDNLSKEITLDALNRINREVRKIALKPMVFADQVSNMELNFEVVESPGKGMGMVATCDLKPGKIMLVESPLLTLKIPPDFQDYEQTNQDIGPELDRILSELPDDKRMEFFQLSDSMLYNNQSTALGVVKTNAFIVSGGRMAVFALTSRINHSCTPNVHYYPVSRNAQNPQRRMILRAVKPVKAGEELFVSYAGTMPHEGFDTASNRRERLRKSYNFVCECDACENQLDDDKRKRVAEIDTFDLVEEQYRLCCEIGVHSGILCILALECIVELGKKERCISEIKLISEEARTHVKIGYGDDLQPVLNSLDEIDKAENESQIKEPIETIEKILDLFGDIDIGY